MAELAAITQTTMKLVCLHEDLYEGVAARLAYLERACHAEHIEFCPLNSRKVDYSALPALAPGDLLYNSARGSESLETLLLGPQVVTFYRSQPAFIPTPSDMVDWSILHQKAGLSTPKTIFNMTSDRSMLARYVEYLGGFPLILKARASTRGLGTIRVESWPNLLSTADFLLLSSSRFIMRQYIPNTGTARLIVLGESIIASEFRENLPNDFRVSGTNGERNYYPRDFSQECHKTAIAATALANVVTAGVDLVLDEKGVPYLLEINFPHNFVPPQLVTGVDIAGLMVRWLKKRSLDTFGR
jgi:hypothetical protein